MAQENEDRLHAGISFGFDDQDNWIVTAASGIELASIIQTAAGVVQLQLVDGIADPELATAVGTGTLDDDTTLTIAFVRRIPGDPDLRTFEITILDLATGNPAEGGGSVTWWRITQVDPPFLVPPPPPPPPP